MNYISTRGEAPPLSFEDAVMRGLAPDGGLFLPQSVPNMGDALPEWRGLPFAALFARVVAPYLGGALDAETLRAMADRSYAVFSHPDVTPVVRVGSQHVCELFHGPTLAFKDVALQFLGNLFEHFLARRGERLTIAGATSGDTGSAAIHALKGRQGVEVFILYPHGRVSPMQEAQMVTVPEENIHCIAVEGSFDDAQALVKSMFNDAAFNAEYSLGAINSINWARVMAQVTYFFHAYFQVLDAEGGMQVGDPVIFAVPTGNFGHIYAGTLARRMGLPIERLVLATNENAILANWLETGRYQRGEARQTLSPSMDIQVASNFERYLYDLAAGQNGPESAGAAVRGWMGELANTGGFTLEQGLMERARHDFLAQSVDDAQTVETIRQVHKAHGYLLDPHSAVSYRAAQAHVGGAPVITMATAHPAKFSAAITQAIGRPPELPPALAALEGLPKRREVLSADLAGVQQYIREVLA